MVKSKGVFGVLTLTLIGSSIALLGSVLAGYTDPNAFIVTAFLGLAFPFLLIIHVILTVFYFILTKSRLTILFIIPLLASLNTGLNFFGVNFFAPSTQTGHDPFRFMTYNVHGFKPVKDTDADVKPEMFKLIGSENPDIICFQDFTFQPEKKSVVDSLKKILGTPFFYCGPENPDLFPDYALGIFSRFPIINSGIILLSDKTSGNQCIFADVKRGNKTFRVYNVHLQSLKFQEQDYERWDKGNAKNKASFLRHNFRRLQYAFLKRSEQVKIMKKEIASCNSPFIVAGDFNDSPASYAVSQMSSELKNAFREKATGYEVTYNGDMPNFQIDYVLTKPVFKVENYRVITRKLSDHFPVRVDLSF